MYMQGFFLASNFLLNFHNFTQRLRGSTSESLRVGWFVCYLFGFFFELIQEFIFVGVTQYDKGQLFVMVQYLGITQHGLRYENGIHNK